MTSEVMARGYDVRLSSAMPATESRHSNVPTPGATVGALLRHWRTARRLSQLELALHADVSSRHLSYVETGRSQPSREMVLLLADALEIPLRERNALLVAGGYAPRYFETGLGAPEMAQVRGAIELILGQQEPSPAFVLDRHWDVRMANQAAARCNRFLLGADPTESNMMRLVLHPNGLRPVMVNWEETAGDLIRHLHNQIAVQPSDERARALLAEVLAYPGVPARWRTREIGAPDDAALDDDFPQSRRGASVLLDLHDFRHSTRRRARGAAHRVHVPG